MAGYKQFIKLTPEEYEKKFRELRERVDALTKNNINLKFVSIRDIKIEETDGCINQIVVRYRNKSFDVLPRSIHGAKIKDFLGVRYTRIESWAVLPFEFAERDRGSYKDNMSNRYLYGENC
jgi:hypothetical protein